MTTVLDYTRKLLYEHDCVVLPDLGGFLAYFSHAFYSEQNDLFHPPQKRVAFNEALKLDDGLLVHYMTINEQLTREDAQKRVRQFVDSIKVDIKEKGEYTLEGIGVLATNEEGKLQFEPTPTTNFYADGYGLKSLQVVSLNPKIEIQSTPIDNDWTESNRSAEALPIEVPRRRSRVALYVGGALLIGTTLVGAFTQFPAEILKSSLNPFELATTAKSWMMIDKKSNNVKSIKMSPVVVLDKLSMNERVDESKESIAKATSATVESVKVKETIQVEKKIEKVNKISTLSRKSDENTNYWVIAGGFSQLSNAEKLLNKLQRNGYENATILNPEVAEGKLVIVAAIGCDNSNKAKMQIASVSKLAGADAYVIHR